MTQTADLRDALLVDGVPGASARREQARRKAAHDARIREKHPRVGGLVLAWTGEPRRARDWRVGAEGEERVGQRLSALTTPTIRVLHDRGLPGRRTNLDHVVITSAGVFVVDTKHHRGRRPERRVVRERGRREERLLLSGRNETRLVEKALAQVAQVRAVVPDYVPVRGVLCFHDAQWSLLAGAFRVQDVDVVWPRRLARLVREPGPLGVAEIAGLHRDLMAAFPSA